MAEITEKLVLESYEKTSFLGDRTGIWFVTLNNTLFCFDDGP